MKIWNVLCLALVVLPLSINAADITDVPKSDSAYTSIKNTVEGGFLPLFHGNQFKDKDPISRREMALAIDKLLQKVDQDRGQLNPTEIQELIHLAKSFKHYLADYETSVVQIKKDYSEIKSEHTTLNNDLSAANEQFKNEMIAMKKSSEDTSLYSYIGIGIAIALAILVR